MTRYARNTRPKRRFNLNRKVRPLLVVLFSLPLIALLYGSGALDGPKPPTLRLKYAKESLERAADAGAIFYSPERYRRAEKLIQQGWMEMARQNGRISIFRNYRRADSLLTKATDLAEESSQVTQDSLSTLETRAQSEYRALETELKNWREALDGTFIIYTAERYWSDAEIRVKQAKSLAAVKEYQAAHDVVVIGHKALGRLGAILAESEEDESSSLRMWRNWVENAVAETRLHGDYALIVNKAGHKTYLVKDGKPIHTYDCELGYNSARSKLFAGDGATPEGVYRVTSVKKNGNSKFYKALLINYPNDADKRRFAENKRKGVISSRAGIGKLIELHGGGGNGRDWTDGCVAYLNEDMDRILKYVGVGTPVVIVRRYDGWK